MFFFVKKNCVLSLNGDDGVCRTQRFPASPFNSSVLGSSFNGVQGSWIQIQVAVVDVYLRPAATSSLSTVLRNGALTVANVVSITTSDLGSYAINFTTPSRGTLLLFVSINGSAVGDSPFPVTVVASSSPTNLTWLWVTLALVLCGAAAVLGVFVYRRYFRRVSYLPIADTSKHRPSYGGTGFSTDAEEV